MSPPADDPRPLAIARQLRDELLAITGNDLAAIWLYGASVFGHPFVDIDLHILMHHQLADRQWEKIRQTHQRLAQEASLNVKDLDAWYIALADARLPVCPTHLDPSTQGIKDNHWPLHRAHWLAGKCAVIYGLEPAAVVPPPTWEELETTLREEMRVPEPNAYWALQLCRVWASLATRDVVRSKIDSGNWAIARLPTDHHPVINAAIRFYQRRAEPHDQELIRRTFPALLAEINQRVMI